MSVSNNSKGNNNSNSIYDFTQKLEEELTYIYEMRMKQNLKSSETSERNSDKINSNQSNVLKGNQSVSFLAR
jgi:hypothetical protein